MKKSCLSVFALTILLTLALLFSSCESKIPEPEDTQLSVYEETTAEPVVNDLELISGGEAIVRLVRPDADSTDSDSVSAAKIVRETLLKYCKSVEFLSDWTKDGTHDPSTVEILVGMTDYDETSQAMSGLGYGSYAVKIIGNKICVVAPSGEGLEAAAEALCKQLQASVSGSDGAYNLVLSGSFSASGTASERLDKIPVSDGGKLMCCYNPGDSCQEVIIESAGTDDYTAYLSKLEAAGYKYYTSHDIKANRFATYYNSEYTINVGYYDYYGEIRIIQEPYSEKTLIGLESDNVYTEVTTSQLTMVGCEYYNTTKLSYQGNGLSIVIRLTDGRFIIVDGGFTRSEQADILVNLLKEQSKDYIDTTKKITVAAWIVTHAHSDHFGVLNKQYPRFKNAGIVVENVIVNFMSDSERIKAINTYIAKGSTNWSESEGSGWGNTYSAANALGADLVIAHVGQVFYFANATLETLYTIESYAPEMVNALNACSLIFKMTFTDSKTGKQTTYMSTGDATGTGFQITNRTFGDYLQCDILQVAHHGGTTWGNDVGTMTAYKTIAAATILWPHGDKTLAEAKARSYNKVLENTTYNPNFKESFSAGWEGSTVILPMPYTGGSAIVNKLQEAK